MKTILVVEDDDEIREIEIDYLTEAGFKIQIAQNGQEAIDIFDDKVFDLVVLDLNLPIVDGIEVCKNIREKSGIPIIMVTAKIKEMDELLGLEIGADDYIKKPFSPKILVSRVQSLLKRPQLLDTKNITYGEISLDQVTRTVTKKGENIDLTTIQLNILEQLMLNPGKVFSRYELIDRSYSADDIPDIFDRTMDSHIKNIRKQIEKDSKKPEYILTVRGMGYKLNEDI